MEETVGLKLFTVIQAAFGKKTEPVLLSVEDVENIERIATRQSILYIIIVGIKKLGYENLLSERAKRFIAKAAYDYVQQEEALKEIARALDEKGIGYVPLKGAVLRNLYPQPCMRSCSDIDVLVREECLEDAVNAIESLSSFKSYERTDHDVQFVNKRVHLELHFSLTANLARIDNVLERAWKYTIPTARGEQFYFTPEFNTFYIVAHAARHLIKEGGVGIRPLLDLWILQTNTVFDKEKVESLCEEAGILGYFKACCDILLVWFEGGEHTEMTKLFERLVLSGGVFGSEYLRIVSRRRVNRSSRKYVFKRVFRTSDDIKEFYPICRKHPVLVPWYQLVRWTKMFLPSKRQTARRELKQRREINQSVIDEYDTLLKSMGL